MGTWDVRNMIEVALAEYGDQDWMSAIYGSVDICENDSGGAVPENLGVGIRILIHNQNFNNKWDNPNVTVETGFAITLAPAPTKSHRRDRGL